MANEDSREGSYASIENLNKVRAYLLAREFGKVVWGIVIKWDYLTKDTVGKQFIRAVDSISANIAEGYGAFFYSETIRFYYYARRSSFESNDWFSKAIERNLLSDEEIKKIREIKKDLPLEINKLIKRVRTKKTKQ